MLKGNLEKEPFTGWADTYSRQIALAEIGCEGQRKISKGRVCVIGVGGLGCESSIRLAAMGVGYLKLVDRDVVSRSDLHRQILYDLSSVGKSKVEVAAEKLLKLNPNMQVDPLPVALTPSNVESIVKDVDVVVDGLDSLPPRYWVNRACVKNNVPYVFGSAIQSYGNLSTILPSKSTCLECFYPKLENMNLPRCASVGVHPSIVGVIANLQVYEAVRVLTDQPPKLTDKLMYVDLAHMGFEIVGLKKRRDCAACGGKAVSEPGEAPFNPVEEFRAGDGSKTMVITPPKPLELNLEELMRRGFMLGWNPSTMGRHSLNMRIKKGVTLSLLSSGVGIVSIAPELAGKFKLKEVKAIYGKLGLQTGFLP
ncbi:MAG: HesA/MoeB/ThiF family protein [Candidatus Bathyarchaeia archaeon]